MEEPLNSKVESVSSWKKKISIEVSAQEIKPEIENKISEYAKNISVPGFRPGKVPAAFVRTKYGKEVEAEVIDLTMKKAFSDAAKENSLSPIHTLPLGDEDFFYDEKEGLKFTITFEVSPEVDIKDYKGHGIKAEIKEVKDNDVDAEILSMAKRRAVPVLGDNTNQKAAINDWVVVDYAAMDVENPDPKSDYRIGLIPDENGKMDGFANSLVGKKAGDEYETEYEFPKSYNDPDIAGKTVKFKVKVKKVEKMTVPTIDDKFAESFNYKNLEDMKVKVKEMMIERETQEGEGEAFAKILDFIVTKNEFEVPESMVNNYIEDKFKQVQQYNSALEFEVFAKGQKDEAEKEVKKYYILNDIAKKENIKVTQKEVDEKIQELASMYQMDFDQLKETLRKRGETISIRENLKVNKTLKCLLENS